VNAFWIAAFVALSLVVLVIVAVLLGVLRRAISVLEQAESRSEGSQSLPVQAIPTGTRVGDFALRNGSHGVVNFNELVQRPTVVLLISAECGPCHRLVSELRAAKRRLAALDLIVITDATPASETDSDIPLYIQMDRAATIAFESNATPHAFLVDVDRVVLGSRIPRTPDDLIDLYQVAKGGDTSVVDLAEEDVQQREVSHE